MGPDAVNQYREVSSGIFTDWHPPVMAWLWSYFDAVFPGSGLVFALHQLLYWAGFALLAGAFARAGHAVAALCVASIALIPSHVFLTLEITKDVGLAATFLAASAIVYAKGTDDRARALALAAGALLLAYGTLVRTNAIFAAPPLILYLLKPGLARRPVAVIGSCLALSVALIPVASFVNHRLIGAQDSGAIKSLIVFDLAGVAVRTRDPAILPGAASDFHRLTRCYTPVLWDPLGKPGCNFINGLNAAPIPHWMSVVAARPLAYASHRSAYFTIALNTNYLRYLPEDEAYRWRYFLNVTPSSARDRVIQGFLALSPFRPVFALILGMFTMALLRSAAVRSTREGKLAFFLTLSGLGYVLGYLVVGVASEFRYFFWPMLALPIALIAALAARAGTPAERNMPAWRIVALVLALAAVLQVVLPVNFQQASSGQLIDRRTGLPVPAESPYQHGPKV